MFSEIFIYLFLENIYKNVYNSKKMECNLLKEKYKYIWYIYMMD